jgi:hypothetical protein
MLLLASTLLQLDKRLLKTVLAILAYGLLDSAQLLQLRNSVVLTFDQLDALHELLRHLECLLLQLCVLLLQFISCSLPMLSLLLHSSLDRLKFRPPA